MKNEEKHISFAHLMAAIRATNHKGEGIPFSISFITADKRRNTGGELFTIPNAVFLPNYLNASKEIRRLAMPKSPKHYQHSTLNLFNLDTLRIVKIHPRLILFFNSQKVIY
jgi:hypothetical protein